jgi:hypothetical protein
MTGMHRDTIQAATNRPATSLKPLLVGIVARRAERLPVGSIPKQGLITVVRLHVIDHRRQANTPQLLTHHTLRMRPEMTLASLPPRMSIAALC